MVRDHRDFQASVARRGHRGSGRCPGQGRRAFLEPLPLALQEAFPEAAPGMYEGSNSLLGH